MLIQDRTRSVGRAVRCPIHVLRHSPLYLAPSGFGSVLSVFTAPIGPRLVAALDLLRRVLRHAILTADSLMPPVAAQAIGSRDNRARAAVQKPQAQQRGAAQFHFSH